MLCARGIELWLIPFIVLASLIVAAVVIVASGPLEQAARSNLVVGALILIVLMVLGIVANGWASDEAVKRVRCLAPVWLLAGLDLGLDPDHIMIWLAPLVNNRWWVVILVFGVLIAWIMAFMQLKKSIDKAL
jgi:hypothetical protein